MKKLLALFVLCAFISAGAAQADLAPFNPDDPRFRERPQPQPAPQPGPKDKEKDKKKPKGDKKKS